PGLAGQPARGGVEVEDAVGAWGRDNVGVRPSGHRGVAVRPSQPSAEHGRRARRQAEPLRALDPARPHRVPPPPGDGLEGHLALRGRRSSHVSTAWPRHELEPGARRRDTGESDEKGPAARRRPKAAGEAYFLYVEPAVEGANEADGPFSSLSLDTRFVRPLR